MRQIAVALVASLVVAVASLVPGSPATIQAASGPKVVIIVGPVGSATSSYKSDGDAAAAVARKYTANVVQLYTPNATWAAAKAALQGASLVIYMGHGNGFPSPYFSGTQLVPPSPFPQDRVDGLGLNDPANLNDTTTLYAGELPIRQNIRLATGAVVILSHLCYSAGQSEPNGPAPTLTVARARADNMAAGWIAAGAQAVIAEPYYGPAWYVDQLFGTTRTVDAIWRARPNADGNLSTFTSARSPGYVPELDTSQPIPRDPSVALQIYERALVAIPGATFLRAPYVPPAAPAAYVPVSPTRVLDSRRALGVPGAFLSGIPQTFQVVGLANVLSGATAVTGNLTVTGQTRAGYAALTPTPNPFPATSTLNFPLADNRANGVTVPLGPGGTLSAVYVSGRLGDRTQLVFDVTGYFTTATTGARYVSVTPQRILDTRASLGARHLVAGAPATFQVTGLAGVPVGASAVTGNVTVTGQTSVGYVALTPAATAAPATSTLNFPVGDNRANGVTVPLGSDGTLSAVYVAPVASTTDVIFDVTGFFTTSGTGALYVPLMPVRIVDSRIAVGLSGAQLAGHPATFPVDGQGGVPVDATAVTGNLTVTAQTFAGYLALTPTATAAPTTSTLNFPAGDNRANGVDAPIGTDGTLSSTYITGRSTDSTQLVFDVTGYFR